MTTPQVSSQSCSSLINEMYPAKTPSEGSSLQFPQVVILICGRIASGKDTIADYLVSRYNFKKYAFADELKKRASLMYNIPLDHFYSRKFKEIVYPPAGISPRNACIELGTMQRKQDNDYWANSVVFQISKAVPDRVVISDCRYPNEYDVIKKNFMNSRVICYWVSRNTLSSIVHSDSSENSIHFYSSFIDEFIDNNGNIKDLHKSIDSISHKWELLG